MLALEAMDRWAAHPKQNPELVKRAISIFRRSEEEAPLVSPRILQDWRAERAMFVDLVWNGNNPNPQNRTVAEMGIVRWCLPWELLRLQRVQDAMFSRALDEVQLVERELHDRGYVDVAFLKVGASSHSPWNWRRTTLEPPIDSPEGWQLESSADGVVNQAARTSLHFLAWAVADFRREHHKLPQSLSELVPTYFAELPIDPWTGRAFLYEPQGVPVFLNVAGQGWHANQPFVASAGGSQCRIVVNPSFGGALGPVRILTRQGHDVNASHQSEPLNFPAPALAIPSVGGAQKPDAKWPARPTSKPSTAPAGKPPAKPIDNLFTKPAVQPPAVGRPAGKVPSQK
jgi:hypothetical protein